MKNYKETNDKIFKLIRSIYSQDEINLHVPLLDSSDYEMLEDCIKSTYVSTVGQYIKQFENEISKFTKAKYCVAVVNGTSALHLSLVGLNCNSDSEVITQSLTFVATSNAIRYTGASPVYIDVDKKTLSMCPVALRTWLEKNVTFKKKNNISSPINKKTGKNIKAILPMHTFGHSCRIEEIVEIANEFNIKVVEDCAESLGSYYKNKHTGTWGEIGALSFNGNKIITTGGGGMLLTNNEKLARRLRHLSTQAKLTHKWNYIHDDIGYNYRMPNINAALGISQLKKLKKILESKKNIANKYKKFFKDLKYSRLTFLEEPNNCNSNYWLNTVIFEEKEMRNCFLEQSHFNKIKCRPAWELNSKLQMFTKFETDDLKNSKYLCDRIVNLPSSAIF